MKLCESYKGSISRVEELTGGIPRELNIFVNNVKCIEEDFINLREDKFSERLNHLRKGMDEYEKKEFKEVIEKFFAPKFVGAPNKIFGNFYDKGIIYREKLGGELRILNLPAKNVLFNEYIKNIKIEPINSGKVILFLKISHR